MSTARSRIIIYTLVAINALIILGWWLYASGLPAVTTSDRLNSLGRITGLIAAFAALLELFLMSRLPMVERAFGLTKLVWFHRWNGYIMVYALIAHPIFLSYGYQIQGKPDPITQFLNFIFHYPDMYKALIGSILIFLVAGLSISIARKRVSYEVWYLVHLTTYVAIVLAFFHQLTTGGDFIGYPIFSLYWVALIVAAFALIAVYRIISPYLLWIAHRPIVDRVEVESDGVFSIYISGKDFYNLEIRAGQYFGFQFLGQHLWTQSHPFTVSKVPTNNELRITFKVYGSYTSYLSKIKPGTPVLLDGPRGNSTWERSRKPRTVMIAGGIGITPFRALLEAAPAGQDIVLLYCCHTQAEAPLLAELTATNTKAKVDIIPVFGDDLGRLTPELLARLVPDISTREAYLCGPDPLVFGTSNYLQTIGIKEKDIHTERFSY
jgi:predicted ferric reductase